MCTERVFKNGGETRDGVNIHSSNATCIDAGDTDSVRSKVTKASFKGSEIIDSMDTDIVYLAEVFESNRDANEEGVD